MGVITPCNMASNAMEKLEIFSCTAQSHFSYLQFKYSKSFKISLLIQSSRECSAVGLDILLSLFNYLGTLRNGLNMDSYGSKKRVTRSEVWDCELL